MAGFATVKMHLAVDIMNFRQITTMTQHSRNATRMHADASHGLIRYRARDTAPGAVASPPIRRLP